jgi:hypothetical protein
MSRFSVIEENEIQMLIESSKKGMHKTLEGQMVKLGSSECREDILRRMDDVSYNRNDQGYGSDARVYFSGVLNVLRRKLRENDKVANAESESTDAVLEESRKYRASEKTADRLLKLAGLID